MSQFFPLAAALPFPLLFSSTQILLGTDLSSLSLPEIMNVNFRSKFDETESGREAGFGTAGSLFKTS